jgi:hypothetical protein
VNNDFELPEGVKEVTRTNTEWSRPRADLALDRNRQQPFGGEAFDHGAVEPAIPEDVGEMAEDQIDERTFRKPAVEVHHIEAAAVGDAGKRCQPTGEIDGHRGDVDGPDLHPPISEPHRLSATTARQLQRVAFGGKEILERREYRRRERADRCHTRCGVALIPVSTVLLAHGRNATTLQATPPGPVFAPIIGLEQYSCLLWLSTARSRSRLRRCTSAMRFTPGGGARGQDRNEGSC